MTFEQFSELWNKYVGNRQRHEGPMTPTLKALIEYANGDKTKVQLIRSKLNRPPIE